MNPNTLIRHRRDLFLASRNPFAARWSTLQPQSLVLPTLASGPETDGTEPDEDADDDEFDDEDDEVNEDEDNDDDEAEQTAEPTGQFPDAPGVTTPIV